MTRPELTVLRPEGRLEAPPDRGRLLTADQVATELLGGTVRASWVRRHVPGKVVLGHSTIRWWEQDVRAWLESRRASPERASVL